MHARTLYIIHRYTYIYTRMQVICNVCGTVSGREEPFYDLIIPVDGHPGFIESLNSLTAYEDLTGDATQALANMHHT